MDLFTKLFGDFLLFVYHCFDWSGPRDLFKARL